MLAEYSTTVSNINTMRNTDLLAQGWDWHVAGCLTLTDYVNKVTCDTNRTFFWLHENTIPVAYFGFSLHPDFNSFQTGTFIPVQHRNRGINSIIKYTAIAAFQTMQIPLISTILETNERSLKAMSKITGQPGTPFQEQYRNTKSYLFELNNITVPPEQINPILLNDILNHKNKFDTILNTTSQLIYAA